MSQLAGPASKFDLPDDSEETSSSDPYLAGLERKVDRLADDAAEDREETRAAIRVLSTEVQGSTNTSKQAIAEMAELRREVRGLLDVLREQVTEPRKTRGKK